MTSEFWGYKALAKPDHLTTKAPGKQGDTKKYNLTPESL